MRCSSISSVYRPGVAPGERWRSGSRSVYHVAFSANQTSRMCIAALLARMLLAKFRCAPRSAWLTNQGDAWNRPIVIAESHENVPRLSGSPVRLSRITLAMKTVWNGTFRQEAEHFGFI